jgi:hypothetical protein
MSFEGIRSSGMGEHYKEAQAHVLKLHTPCRGRHQVQIKSSKTPMFA